VSIRFKLLLFVVTISASVASATLLVQQFVMLPEFAHLEQRQADDDVKRCEQALQRDLEFLSRSSGDYGTWDDTYEYVAGRDENYEGGNLVPETYDNLDIDVLMILRSDGGLVWGKRRADGGELVDARELVEAISRNRALLLGRAASRAKRDGIVITPHGLLLVGASAITTSDGQAPSQGTFLMGRFLDDAVVAALAERTGVALSMAPLDAVPASDRSALDHLSRPGASWRDSHDATKLRSYKLLGDVEGRPALLLRADLPRMVTGRARNAAASATLTSVVAGLLMSIVTWLVLARMIVAPLTQVTQHAVRVGAEGDLSARLELGGKDEIAVLAREFDRMVERLAVSRTELVEMAHGAGRAEIAVNVLHNVGNVLNSANVAANLMSRTLANSEVESLVAGVRMIEQHEADLVEFLSRDERGRHLPSFLVEVSAHLASETQTLRSETKTLCASIEHIRQIVRAQSEFSRSDHLIEPTDPAAVIEQALVLTSDSFEHHHIRVERRLHECGRVALDRHRVLQVVTNLIANAKHAVKGVDEKERWIAIELDRLPEPGDGVLCIRVVDNGVGIPPENLERIFSFGFSTRPGGQGVGLHSAANQAREMGGDLRAESAGAGHGAVFTLTLPIRLAGVAE
jgi:sensor domain CHASE-containing protein/anti-sigma regulatory factor (Ser/Thr protein kinase)